MAYDAYLKIDGISVNSKSNYGIELESWSWGVTNSGNPSEGTGYGAGQVSFRDFSFTAAAGTQSPQLFTKAVTGEVITSATLTIDGAPEVITIKFSDVIIASYKMDEHAQASSLKIDVAGGAYADTAPAEAVSFNFAQMVFTVGSAVGTGSSIDSSAT